MNNLLFAVLIIALLYYFYYRKKSISPPTKPWTSKPSTHSQSTQTESLTREYEPEVINFPGPETKSLTQSISTQTNLSDKQISLLTQQWNQVASWAQELGIDTNKSWNLTMLKNKIKQELEAAKKPPLKANYSRTTQTDPESDLENTLDNLLNSIQDLNNQIK